MIVSPISKQPCIKRFTAVLNFVVTTIQTPPTAHRQFPRSVISSKDSLSIVAFRTITLFAAVLTDDTCISRRLSRMFQTFALDLCLSISDLFVEYYMLYLYILYICEYYVNFNYFYDFRTIRKKLLNHWLVPS